MFSFDLSKIDFRQTPIENIFLDTYLSQADGDAIKVYLAGWKEAYNSNSYKDSIDSQTRAGANANEGLSLEKLAQGLEMDEDKVLSALDFWHEAGLLEIVEGDPPTYRFKSMLLLWSGVSDPAPSQAKSRENNSTNDLNELMGDSDKDTEELSVRREQMFKDLEDFLSKDYTYRVLLKDNEIRLILDVMDRYNFSPEYFIYAYKKASSGKEIGARSVNYIVAIIENWARFEGITDIGQLDSFLAKQEEVSKKPVRKKRKGRLVTSDKRMSRQEEQDWVKKKLEESRLRGLKGGLRGKGD